MTLSFTTPGRFIPTLSLTVCWPPRSFLPLQVKTHRAAEAFCMSEPNVRRYLRTHRICYPPDYRQLAERGLSPRKIRSFVGCSLLRKLSLVFYGWEERLLAFLVGAVLLSALVFVLCAVHLDL